MPDRILAGPMMRVMVRDTEHSQVFINGVGVVAVDMMELKADAERLADAASPFFASKRSRCALVGLRLIKFRRLFGTCFYKPMDFFKVSAAT